MGAFFFTYPFFFVSESPAMQNVWYSELLKSGLWAFVRTHVPEEDTNTTWGSFGPGFRLLDRKYETVVRVFGAWNLAHLAHDADNRERMLSEGVMCVFEDRLSTCESECPVSQS